MKIGVTGTRSGMTEFQKTKVKKFIAYKAIIQDGFAFDKKYDPILEFHHGDCVGVDVEAAEMASEFDYRIICHPPVKDDLRAFYPYDEIRPADTYFARNRNIVNAVDFLIVVPFQDERQNHGGTWYTHDYAKKINKRL